MIYEINNNTANVDRVHDALLRHDGGFGGSVRWLENGFLRIEWTSANTTEQNIIDAIAEQDTLTVNADKTSIPVVADADNPQASETTTITCAELASFGWRAWLDGVLVDEGASPLEWASAEAGVYTFEIYEDGGFRTGTITITVTEV